MKYYCKYHEIDEDENKFPLSMRKNGGYCTEAIDEYRSKKATFLKKTDVPITLFCRYHEREEDIALFKPNDITTRKQVTCEMSNRVYRWWYAIQKKDAKNHLVCRSKTKNKQDFKQFLSDIETRISDGRFSLDDISGSLQRYIIDQKPPMQLYCWNHMCYEPANWFWYSQHKKNVVYPKCKISMMAWRDFVKLQPKGDDGKMTAPKEDLRQDFFEYLPRWEENNNDYVNSVRNMTINNEELQHPDINDSMMDKIIDSILSDVNKTDSTDEGNEIATNEEDSSNGNEGVHEQHLAVVEWDDYQKVLNENIVLTRALKTQEDNFIKSYTEMDIEIARIKQTIDELTPKYLKSLELIEKLTRKILGE